MLLINIFLWTFLKSELDYTNVKNILPWPKTFVNQPNQAKKNQNKEQIIPNLIEFRAF